ncbi:hypothetical protein D3877_12045 [Azospirillum cavernae]|uniref:Uncharacterized protein n=2 Tax=Azospirillum cavernae TaxID=2320860 RepID=A0A418VUX2_9PROT|nr:hypothetical protein D3877_12045 [Azospirillum cavernae]
MQGRGAPMMNGPAEERAEGSAGHNPTEEALEEDQGGQIQGDQPNVSPEEQAQYDQFMDQAFRLIYDQKSFPQVMKRLVATPDPVEGLAAVVVMVVQRLQDTAKQQGVQLSGDVLYHGGADLLADLADTAEKAGIHTFSPQELEKALYRALDLYRTMGQQSGQLDPRPFQQDWDVLQRADKAGRLDEVLPQFGKGRENRGDEPQPSGRRGLMPPQGVAQQQGGM